MPSTPQNKTREGSTGLNATPRPPRSGPPSAAATPRGASAPRRATPTATEQNVATRMRTVPVEKRADVLMGMRTRADNLRGGRLQHLPPDPYANKRGNHELSDPPTSDKLWADLRKITPRLDRVERDDALVRHPVEGPGADEGKRIVTGKSRHAFTSSAMLPSGKRTDDKPYAVGGLKVLKAPDVTARPVKKEGVAVVAVPPSFSVDTRAATRRVPGVGLEDAQPTFKRHVAGHPSHCLGGQVATPDEPPRVQCRARTPLADGKPNVALRSRSNEQRSFDVVSNTRSRSVGSTNDPFDEPKHASMTGAHRRSSSDAAAHFAKQPDNRIADPRKFRKGAGSVWGAHRPADHDIFAARARTPPPPATTSAALGGTTEPFGTDSGRPATPAGAAAAAGRGVSPRARRALVEPTAKVTATARPSMPSACERSPIRRSSSAPRPGLTLGAPRVPGGGVLARKSDTPDKDLKARKGRTATAADSLSFAKTADAVGFGLPPPVPAAAGAAAPSPARRERMMSPYGESATVKARGASPRQSVRDTASSLGFNYDASTDKGLRNASPVGRSRASAASAAGTGGYAAPLQRTNSGASVRSADSAAGVGASRPPMAVRTSTPTRQQSPAGGATRGRAAVPANGGPASRAQSPTNVSVGVAGAFSWA